MPEVALEGQKRLKAAKVLCIGAGGLGSPLALYLAAAGVGRLGIVDFDVVDFTNLQRQIIHSTANVGRPKLESALAIYAQLFLPLVHVIERFYSLAFPFFGGHFLTLSGFRFALSLLLLLLPTCRSEEHTSELQSLAY